LVLGDAELDCGFGREAVKLRRLIRTRRAFIRAGPFLDLGDLGALTAAWLVKDSVISYQVHLQAIQRIKDEEAGRLR